MKNLVVISVGGFQRATMKFIVAFILAASACAVINANYVRNCYYTNWAQYRPPPMKYFPENLDPFLCTHIFYAFAKIGRGSTLAMYEWNDDKMYPRMMAMKKQNPDLKVLLAVGGWNHENGNAQGKFSVMVNNDSLRKGFIDSAVALLRKWGFDGLDLDWEYPGSRDSGKNHPGDKQKFTQLCKELLHAFETDAAKRQMPRLLLTAAVAAGKPTIDAGYEAKELGNCLDYLNLMAYDLHGAWDTVTGHHTAMKWDGVEGENRKEFTVTYAVEYWISKGFPASKIALGMGTYGRAFRLKDGAQNGLGAPVTSGWPQPPKGRYTREAGFLAYYEICNRKDLTYVDETAVDAPYAYSSSTKEWIGYDNKKSLKLKVDKLIKGKNLAGAMFWCLDLDDFTEKCGEGKYPLMSSVAQELGGYNPPTPKIPRSPPPTLPTEKPPPPGQSTVKPPPVKTNAPPPGGKGCKSIGRWRGIPNMDEWCITNCAAGNCPSDMCKCT